MLRVVRGMGFILYGVWWGRVVGFGVVNIGWGGFSVRVDYLIFYFSFVYF